MKKQTVFDESQSLLVFVLSQFTLLRIYTKMSSPRHVSDAPSTPTQKVHRIFDSWKMSQSQGIRYFLVFGTDDRVQIMKAAQDIANHNSFLFWNRCYQDIAGKMIVAHETCYFLQSQRHCSDPATSHISQESKRQKFKTELCKVLGLLLAVISLVLLLPFFTPIPLAEISLPHTTANITNFHCRISFKPSVISIKLDELKIQNGFQDIQKDFLLKIGPKFTAFEIIKQIACYSLLLFNIGKLIYFSYQFVNKARKLCKKEEMNEQVEPGSSTAGLLSSASGG